MSILANFIVQFPLITEKYQEDILNKRFEIGRQIYNTCVNKSLKAYKEMIKTKKYRGLLASLTGDKKKDKDIWKEINKIRGTCGFTEYDMMTLARKHSAYFNKNIDSKTAEKIGANLWRAWDRLFYGNGNSVKFKKYGELNSLEGGNNRQGIRFKGIKDGKFVKIEKFETGEIIKEGKIFWNGLEIPVKINANNSYEAQTMTNPHICFCRAVRKFIRNKYKFYVQIVFKGNPPTKKHTLGKGDVGIDIGTSTVAYSSDTSVKILELADMVQDIENEKRRLLRKMDRSRRATNPENYNEDGTIRKQGNKKVKWNKSNHYTNYQNKLKELYRKQADVRKLQHECLANEIVQLGDKFYVEDMNFQALQKRSTKTEKNDKGKFKKKKRFGKSIANRAPAMLLSIINRKLSYYGRKLIEIDTWNARASQFNHFDETYKKKKLSQRWNDFNGIKVQRDIYSAFLIMNVNNDLKSFDVKKCNERFDKFYKLHNLEVERLTGNKNLSSIAI